MRMENGVFVMEVKVFHSTQYALRHDNVEAAVGQAIHTEIKMSRHEESRRNVFMFVNQGNRPLTIYYWPCPPIGDFM